MIEMIRALTIAVALLPLTPVSAQDCQLCVARPEQAAQAQPAKPLKIDIETALDFSTAAHTDMGQGSIQLDPATGQRRFAGLVGVGGAALRGMATVTGQPFRRVRVDLPRTIRLNATMGAKADVTDIQSTLGPDPMIGPDGRLVFWFGGRLTVTDNAAGEFHGRIQISADYQ